jgi:hypothetical protein
MREYRKVGAKVDIQCNESGEVGVWLYAQCMNREVDVDE